MRYISQDAFLHLEHGDRELAEIAYKHCETVRQVSLILVIAHHQVISYTVTYEKRMTVSWSGPKVKVLPLCYISRMHMRCFQMPIVTSCFPSKA